MSTDTMQQKSVRLEPAQIKALKARAKKIASDTGMKCDISALVRLAVDKMILAGSK